MIRAARMGTGRLRPWAAGLAGGLLLVCSMAVQAQAEAGAMKREAALREAPGEASRSLASLPAETLVTRLGGRQGPWIQVRNAAGTTGWVHMFDVGSATGSGGGSAVGGALRSVTNFFNKAGPQRTTPTSTIGIRGLGAEDLAQAQPNPAAVGQMEALRQGENEARDFARQAALTPVAVEPLPAAATRAQPAAPGQPGMLP